MNIRAKVFGDQSEEPTLIRAKRPKGVRADDLHSIAVTRKEPRRVNTRDGDRHRLPREQVEVVCDGTPHEVQLVNVSGGGAMIAGDLPVRLWDPVELRLGGDGRIECAVCWIKDGRVGLEFAVETRLDCSPSEQAAILRNVIARSFPEIAFEAAEEPVTPSEPQAPEHRDGHRHPLIWLGTVHYNFETSPVRLRNISAAGAMIECSVPLPVGADPLLDLGGNLQLPSTVTWVAGDAAGLRFDRSFDLSQLAQAKPEVAHGQWQRPSYLGGRLSDPAADERWQQMSLRELRDHLEGFCKY